jgi:hypothetical protein
MWLVAGLLVAVSLAVPVCYLVVKRSLWDLQGRWDDIYFRLRERCELVGVLGRHLRQILKTDPKIVSDIEYLLKRMEETSDPMTHAGVQNGLVLTVQTAVEQFHREGFEASAKVVKTMQGIGLVDARLAGQRDRYNDCARRYNMLINTLPFSIAARLVRARERAFFPMLVPWWSTDPAAYGAVSADEIRLQLRKSHAPLVLAPSQREQWSTARRVIPVSRRLTTAEAPGDGQSMGPASSTDTGVPT